MPTLRALQIKVALLLLSALLLFIAGTHDVRAEEAAAQTQAITAIDVDNAVEHVKADANLAQEKKIRTLKWRSDNKETKPQRKRSSGARARGWRAFARGRCRAKR